MFVVAMVVTAALGLATTACTLRLTREMGVPFWASRGIGARHYFDWCEERGVEPNPIASLLGYLELGLALSFAVTLLLGLLGKAG